MSGAGGEAAGLYDREAGLLARMQDVVAQEPRPLLFATVSGAHLYGFPSQDSDVDLRGVHLLPIEDLVGLRRGELTAARTWWRDGLEIDLVTHEVGKFARLLLRPNGYVLEQLLSPLVVSSSPLHEELAAAAEHLVTTGHARHYLGFAATQRRLFARTGQLKPLLYTFRTLLTGTHLMRTGRMLAHLPALAELHRAPDYLSTLIEAKAAGEHRLLADLVDAPKPDRLAVDILRLEDGLLSAAASCALPTGHEAHPVVEDIVIRARSAPGRLFTLSDMSVPEVVREQSD